MLAIDNLPRVIFGELQGFWAGIRPVSVVGLAHGEEVFKFIVCTFAGTTHLVAARYYRGMVHAEIRRAIYLWLKNLGYDTINIDTGELEIFVSGGGYIGVDHDVKAIKFGGYSDAFGMVRKETIAELLDPWAHEYLTGYKLEYIEHLEFA